MIIQFDKNNREITGSMHGECFYFSFTGLLSCKDLLHRVFTRSNGNSLPPYHSLNVSYTVGDDPTSVDRNILSIRQNMGAERIVYMNQQHGDTVILLKDNLELGPHQAPDADALITNIPGVAIMVKQADCQGIILFDPVERAVAVVHSGWRGSVINIVGKTVQKMCSDFGSLAENIHAAIGPSLGPCCAEYVTYRDIFPPHFCGYLKGDAHFDFWKITETQLEDSGLDRENIEKAGVCTRCSTGQFYSHRGEGITGRFGTVAMIKK